MTGVREQVLTGGDVTTGVVRIGDTVRRPIGPHSKAVHTFLGYLASTGFDGAPRLLGIDEQGREILSYMDGETAGRPLPSWVLGEQVLEGVARLLRRLHDHAEGFTLPPGIDWPAPFDIPGVPLPFDTPDIVGHNDVTPANVIFRAGEPFALIDFDLAGPTTRLHDLVQTMRYWAPLLAPQDREEGQQNLDAGRRMRVLADAYGLGPDGRAELLDIADRRFTRSWHTMRFRAEAFGGGWARMWAEGVGDRILCARSWLHAQQGQLESALRG